MRAFVKEYRDRYPKAAASLVKDEEKLLLVIACYAAQAEGLDFELTETWGSHLAQRWTLRSG